MLAPGDIGKFRYPELGQGKVVAAILPSRDSWNEGSACTTDEDQTISTSSGWSRKATHRLREVIKTFLIIDPRFSGEDRARPPRRIPALLSRRGGDPASLPHRSSSCRLLKIILCHPGLSGADNSFRARHKSPLAFSVASHSRPSGADLAPQSCPCFAHP